MKELQEIIVKVRELEPHTPAVLATVVEVLGSSYRLPGARMLILENGETFGTVSGGCLEADVLERAKQILQTSEAQVLTYDTRTKDDSVFALNMGCYGVIRILLEPGRNNELFDFLRDCFEQRQSGVIATLINSSKDFAAKCGARLLINAGGIVASDFDANFQEKLLSACRVVLADKRSRLQSVENNEFFIEITEPPLQLVVFGAGADAIPLVDLAKILGWRVVVIDHRAAFANQARFPNADEIVRVHPTNLNLTVDENSVVVVMTHNFAHDKEILRRILKSPAAYVGSLGPKRRTERILRELGDEGEKFSAENLQKLYSPIGLDIGATAPELIALSIVAEIQAVIAGREGGFLKNRQGSIYNRQNQ